MEPINRRQALQTMAATGAAVAFTWAEAEARQAHRLAQAAKRLAERAGGAYAPQFFNDHEWRTVHILADMIIPADERSGSAVDADVPEFIDFMMVDRPDRQERMREGLEWLDEESRRRFDRTFLDATPTERGQILDDIAWPVRAPEGYDDAVRWFNSFRDLTATGFWSSKMGIEDLQYMGNTVVPDWQGCPPAALEKLGVSYD